MTVDEVAGAFVARSFPAEPYLQDGSFLPYPTYTVTAKDAATGAVLATTRVVAPVTTEMGCKNCHGGGRQVADVTGVSDETARHVLTVHDRISGTDLATMTASGQVPECKSCHGDSATGAPGAPDLLGFSAAIHGWHALFLAGRDEQQVSVSAAMRPDHRGRRIFTVNTTALS